jgi:uncharacterized protein
VDSHKAGLSDKEKATWVSVANAALAKCEKEGGVNCEASAIKQANAAVGSAKYDAECCDGDFCEKCFAEPAATDSVDGIEYHEDAAEIRGRVSFTPEGFLRADAMVARAGILDYTLADGSTRKELWHPDDAKAQLDSLQLLPMTLDHPWGEKPLPLVTPDNAKRLQVGHTGQAVRMDGLEVVAPLVVTDGASIKQVRTGGRRQLSLGYRVKVVREDGIFEGQPYTHRQFRQGHNHLALVAKARAGQHASLRLDGGDMSDRKLSTVKLDGIDYEAAPEVANALTKAQAQMDSLKATAEQATQDLKAKTDEADATKAKLDSATAELETLKKQDRTAEIRTAVKARVALEKVAARVLPADTKLDEMDDGAIRKAVILAKQPTAKLDEQSEVYVQARFDAIVEALPEKDKRAIAEQRATTTQRTDGGDNSPAAARERMMKDSREAWKPRAA